MYDKIKKLTLVFINDGDQYKAFLKLKKDNDDKYIICALSSHAIYFCEKRQIDFCVPSQFYSPKDYYKCKNNSEKNIKDLISILNKYYSIDSKNKIDFRLKIGTYFYHSLYLLIGSLHYNYFCLFKTINKIDPSNIVVFKKRGTKDFFDGFDEVPYENISYILLKNSKYNKLIIPVEYDIKELGDNHLSIFLGKIRKMVIKTPFFFNFYQKIRYYKKLSLIFDISKKHKKKVICLGGISYSWNQVLSSHNPNSYIYIYCYPSKDLPKYDQSVESHGINWEGSFDGLDVYSVISNLFQIIEKTYSKMLKTHKKSLRMIKKFDVAIYSVLPFPWLQYLSHLAQFSGITTIAYQHGEMAFYGQNGLYSYSTELTFTDYYFSFGKEVTKHYSKKIKQITQFKYPISIGSSAIDKLSSINETNGDYILYASCKYFFNYHPFNNRIGPYKDLDFASDFKLYNVQKTVSSYLNKLGKREGTKIIWKLDPHPIRGKVPFEVEHILKVNSESTFQELLKNATLVILDCPTTTCMEACISKKPLFLYLPNPMIPKAQKTINKRAVIGRTPEELVSKIDEYLKSGEYPADVNNREFLKDFGTHLDDGRSAYRAKDFLLNI